MFHFVTIILNWSCGSTLSNVVIYSSHSTLMNADISPCSQFGCVDFLKWTSMDAFEFDLFSYLFLLFLHWIVKCELFIMIVLVLFLMHHGKKKNEDRLKLCLLTYFIGWVTTIVHVEIASSFSCAMTTYVHHYRILWRWVLLLGIVVGTTVEYCRFWINAIECCCLSLLNPKVLVIMAGNDGQ